MTWQSGERAGGTAAADVPLLVGDGLWLSHGDPSSGTRPIRMSDGPTGLRVEQGGETLPATCFPPAATLAASWDRELVEQVGRALAVEARLLGVDVLLAPGVNLKRNPLCGRNFEYFSEDPLLAGALAQAYVEGVQSQGVGASLKHFAANNQEHERFSISADIDERTLRELYLSAFERVVRHARPWTVMCAYNRLNGVHASRHRRLLTDILRDEWGFDGLVVSDWGAVHDPVAAGLDLQMPGDDGTAVALIRAALADGSLASDAVRAAADRVRRLAERCGSTKECVGIGEDVAHVHHELARRAAAAGSVLLANDGVLPLSPGTRIAVIGWQAAEPVIQGGGSSTVVPLRQSALVPALQAALGAAVEYAPGYDWEAVDEGRPRPNDPDEPRSRALLSEALAVAARSDAVVLCLGHPFGVECEGYDRVGIGLPADQEALAAALAELGVPVVVVLTTGAPLTLGEWRHQVAAVLLPGFGGQAGGEALADVLLGASEPTGRLAESWPLRLSDSPALPGYPGERGRLRYGEGVFIGYRWYDALDRAVAYPFGHGLGYADIAVTGVSAAVLDPAGGRVRVRVTTQNRSERAGSTVVQLSVAEDAPLVPRPPRELRGFQVVRLDGGASGEAFFDLDGRDFAFYDVVGACWQRKPGGFTIHAAPRRATCRPVARSSCPPTLRRHPCSTRPPSPTASRPTEPSGRRRSRHSPG